MSLEYSIIYQAENTYENEVAEAFWQFLILPVDNESQELIQWSFTDSLNTRNYISSNGLGFKTIKLGIDKPFTKISFKLECKLIKTNINPYDFLPNIEVAKDYEEIERLDFKIAHEPYLKRIGLATLPEKHREIFLFDKTKTIFENLNALNNWTYIHLYFKTGVTNVETTLEEIIDTRQGVCQDFAHLFCAVAKENGVPARYVSGYIHQGNQYFGDLQMHAWVEAFVPNFGWIGFDPTNNILAANNHVKVAHGKDYDDCAPLKGVVYTTGNNKTSYTVKVQAAQAQQ